MTWEAAPAHFVPPAGEICVFSFALDLPAAHTDELEGLLSPDERARAQRFKLERDRSRYVVGRARLRTILGRYLDREATHLQFRYGAYGKPSLAAESGSDRVHFNMARSHGLGILAIQLDDDLGIDVEWIRPFPDALEIAKRLFAPEEHRALSSLPAAELSAAFFRYWTRKEAVVKSVGRGLSYPVHAFTLARDSGTMPEKIVVETDEGTATRWCLPVPEPAAGYVVALATAGYSRPLACWRWADP